MVTNGLKATITTKVYLEWNVTSVTTKIEGKVLLF